MDSTYVCGLESVNVGMGSALAASQVAVHDQHLVTCIEHVDEAVVLETSISVDAVHGSLYDEDAEDDDD